MLVLNINKVGGGGLGEWQLLHGQHECNLGGSRWDRLFWMQEKKVITT